MDEMKDSVWLLCADVQGAARLRDEIAARDQEPRFVQARTEAELVTLVAALPHEPLGVALDIRSSELDAAEGLVRTLRSMPRVREICTLMAGSDAGEIARLFCAGATEVITAEVAEVSDGATCEARMGTGPSDMCADVSFADDDAYGVAAPPGTCEGPCGAEAQWDEASRSEAGSVTGSRQGCGISANGRDRYDEETPPWEVGPVAGKSSDECRRAVKNEITDDGGRRAPVIVAIAGRGGCGKTTVVASMAAAAARAGLRCAVLDFDLMFGNLPDVFGVDGPIGLEAVAAHARDGWVQECDIEDAAMRVGPGLTLWGPCAEAERSELMARPAEQLIVALRSVADAIFIDTSGQWGDAVAMALGVCDRCLVLGDDRAFSAVSARRAIEVAVRLGVPRARMSSVFNRASAHGEGEEAAMRFEMGVSLSSRLRIADGGAEVAGMLSFGHIDRVIAGQSAFAKSVRTATAEVLRELGCSLGTLGMEEELAPRDRAFRFRLPWHGAGDD